MKWLRNIFRELWKTSSHPRLNRGPLSVLYQCWILSRVCVVWCCGTTAAHSKSVLHLRGRLLLLGRRGVTQSMNMLHLPRVLVLFHTTHINILSQQSPYGNPRSCSVSSARDITHNLKCVRGTLTGLMGVRVAPEEGGSIKCYIWPRDDMST